MKKLVLLTFGILIALTGFSQLTLNVDQDLSYNTEGDTISHELVYQSVTVDHRGHGVVKITFNDHVNKHRVEKKFKIVGMDSEKPNAYVMENDEVGRVRFEHDIIAYKAKIEFKKDKRIMILN